MRERRIGCKYYDCKGKMFEHIEKVMAFLLQNKESNINTAAEVPDFETKQRAERKASESLRLYEQKGAGRRRKQTKWLVCGSLATRERENFPFRVKHIKEKKRHKRHDILYISRTLVKQC